MSYLQSLMGATFLSLVVVAACSSQSTNQPLVCQDSDSALCSGANGCEGTRECVDGEWTECMCETTLDGAGGSDTAGSTNGGASTDSGGSGGAGSGMGGNTSGGTAGVSGDTSTSSTNAGTSTNGGSGGAGGVGGASATGGSGGGTSSAVRGTVVNHWLHPVPGVIVMIGDQQATTDGDGAFEFETVPETYDVMLDVTYPRYGNTGRYGWVYQGVTRRDPTLQVYGGLALRSSNVLVSPENAIDEEGRVTVMALGGDYGRYERQSASATYTSFSYFGPAQINMYGHALQWLETDGLPTEYVAYDSTNLIAFDSEVTDSVQFVADLSETELTSGTISGSVTSPSFDLRQNNVYVRFASNALIQVVDDSPGTEESFTYTVPSLPEASILFAAHEGTLYDGARAVAYQNGLSPGATNVELEIPSAPVLNAPAPGALLEDETVFSWNTDAGAVVWLLSSDAYYEAIFVVTSADEMTVPTFPNGLDLVRPSELYTWRVEAHGNPDSVDAMLGPAGFMGDFHGIAYDAPDGPGAGTGSFATSAASLVTASE